MTDTPAAPHRQEPSPLSCPSARPDTEDSVVFGVVGGSIEEPRVGYLRQPIAATPEVVALAGPADPAAVFRFGGRCAEGACRHFDGARCSLAQRLVQLLPVVTDRLPPCALRPTCRWWWEEGPAACRRCPQVVTYSIAPSAPLAAAATPPADGGAVHERFGSPDQGGHASVADRMI
jgi:hypothetical protein